MAEFRKIYNVGEAAGCDIDISDNSNEKNIERLEKIEAWIESAYGDIFECVQVRTNSENSGLNIYFKGTNSGLYIQQGVTPNGNSIDLAGYILNGSLSGVISASAAKINRRNVYLLLIKSKYGFIVGLYNNVIANNVRMLVINLGNRLLPVYLNPTQAGQNYVYDNGTANVFSATQCSQIAQACLVRFVPPYLAYVPEGIYWNLGSSTSNCVLFEVDGNLYAELQGAMNYNTVALKLEEAEVEDYAGLSKMWS